jgi:lysophospholipase L1-like esterase
VEVASNNEGDVLLTRRAALPRRGKPRFVLCSKPLADHGKRVRQVKKLSRAVSIAGVLMMSLSLSTCTHVDQERKIEFIYLALGASDAVGVGAMPLTEGYVYLINQDLQVRIPGTFLINLAVPGARIDAVIDQVVLATHFHGEADLSTVWIGVNDLVRGGDPSRFQSELRRLLRRLQSRVSTVVVIANLPDLTQLSSFRTTPDPAVTLERVKAFNRAIEVEAPYVNASIVNVFEESSSDDFAFDGEGFHPTAAGHRRLASLFRKTILERVGVR